MNELTLFKEEQNKKFQNTKQFRDAILFEELLRKDQVITLYDCQGTVFIHEYLKNLALALFGMFIGYTWYNEKNKLKWLYCGAAGLFVFSRFYRMRSFQKHFVDTVRYDTKT